MTMPAINYIEHECTMQCDPDCNTQGASYIRADIVDELLMTLEWYNDGRDPVVSEVMSRINAIMEGK